MQMPFSLFQIGSQFFWGLSVKHSSQNSHKLTPKSTLNLKTSTIFVCDITATAHDTLATVNTVHASGLEGSCCLLKGGLLGF